MTYKLPKGVKPYIDSLGPHYKNVDPSKLQGNNQRLLDVAFTSAKQKFFQAGHGFQHLNFDNVEIRIWPGRSEIAFCFGIKSTVGQPVDYVYMARIKRDDDENEGDEMLRWLKSIDFFETVH